MSTLAANVDERFDSHENEVEHPQYQLYVVSINCFIGLLHILARVGATVGSQRAQSHVGLERAKLAMLCQPPGWCRRFAVHGASLWIIQKVMVPTGGPL